MKYGLLLVCVLLGACTKEPPSGRMPTMPPNESTEFVVKGAPLYDECGV